MTPETASPHVWHRVAEAANKTYPGFDFQAVEVESMCKGEDHPYDTDIALAIEQIAEDHGVVFI